MDKYYLETKRKYLIIFFIFWFFLLNYFLILTCIAYS